MVANRIEDNNRRTCPKRRGGSRAGKEGGPESYLRMHE